jgi:hypothetical protein
MIIGIVVTTSFLILSILIIIGIVCCRWRKNRLNRTNKCKEIFSNKNYFILLFFFSWN